MAISPNGADRAAESAIQAVDEEILTYDEIVERYFGESIVMRVTEEEDGGWPSKGVVLAHALEEEEITEAIRSGEIIRRGPDGRPAEPLAMFRAYPFVDAGPELDAAVATFAMGLIKAASRQRDTSAN